MDNAIQPNRYEGNKSPFIHGSQLLKDPGPPVSWLQRPLLAGSTLVHGCDLIWDPGFSTTDVQCGPRANLLLQGPQFCHLYNEIARLDCSDSAYCSWNPLCGSVIPQIWWVMIYKGTAVSILSIIVHLLDSFLL